MGKHSFTSATFGSIVACGALVFASLVTGAIAFESRHLPAETLAQQFVALGVAFLPAISTFVVSYFKLFAPASERHDKWLWLCVGLDLLALLLQGLGIAAREIGQQDAVLEIFNIMSYMAAAISALAIAIAAGTSDHRLDAVITAQAERDLKKTRFDLRKEVLKNDETVRAAIADDERTKILSDNSTVTRPTVPPASPPARSASPSEASKNGQGQPFH